MIDAPLDADLVRRLERERLTGMPRWRMGPQPPPNDDDLVCARRRRDLERATTTMRRTA